MQSEYKIKIFGSDNDEELVSRALNYFLNNHGIKNQKSTLYIGLNKTEWWNMPITPSWRWQETYFMLKTSKIILDGSGG